MQAKKKSIVIHCNGRGVTENTGNVSSEVTLGHVRTTIFAVEKLRAWLSVALVTQHAERMRRIMLSSVTCLSLPYFSILYHKRYDFLGCVCVWGGGTIEYKIFCDLFYKFYLKHFPF